MLRRSWRLARCERLSRSLPPSMVVAQIWLLELSSRLRMSEDSWQEMQVLLASLVVGAIQSAQGRYCVLFRVVKMRKYSCTSPA